MGYAAPPGGFAQDGEPGAHSPFTQALLEHLGTPTISLSSAFARITDAVQTQTIGAQVPWSGASKGSSIYLNGRASPKVPRSVDWARRAREHLEHSRFEEAIIAALKGLPRAATSQQLTSPQYRDAHDALALASRLRVPVLKAEETYVTGVRAGPLLAAYGQSGDVKVFDSTTGEIRCTASGEGGMAVITAHPDGEMLAVARGKEVRLLDPGCQLIREWDAFPVGPADGERTIMSMAFVRRSGSMALAVVGLGEMGGGASSAIRWLDLSSGRSLPDLAMPPAPDVPDLESLDPSILTDQKRLAEVIGAVMQATMRNLVWSIAASADGTRLVGITASEMTEFPRPGSRQTMGGGLSKSIFHVLVWRTASPDAAPAVLGPFDGKASSVRMSHDGSLILLPVSRAAPDLKGMLIQVMVVRAGDGEVVFRSAADLGAHDGAISPDGTRIAIFGATGETYYRGLPEGKVLDELPIGDRAVQIQAVTSRGKIGLFREDDPWRIPSGPSLVQEALRALEPEVRDEVVRAQQMFGSGPR